MKRPLFHCAVVLVCAVAFNALWAILPFHVLANNALPRRPHIAHIGSDSTASDSGTVVDSTSDSECNRGAVPCIPTSTTLVSGCSQGEARACLLSSYDAQRVCAANGYPDSSVIFQDNGMVTCSDEHEIALSQICQGATGNADEQVAYDGVYYCFL